MRSAAVTNNYIVIVSGLDPEVLESPLAACSAGSWACVSALRLRTAPSPTCLFVDEVLAVGDEAFQRQCTDRVEALRGRRHRGDAGVRTTSS